MSLEESQNSLKFSQPNLNQSQTNLKPILFNTDMVRAILDGRKTVTRRAVKPQPYMDGAFWRFGDAAWSKNVSSFHPIPAHSMYNRMPYKPGDTLYVRETWGYDKNNWLYKADYTEEYVNDPANLFKWHPSIHMPQKAARIFIRVTDVRVEELQDITIADCKREGVVLPPPRGDEYDCELDPDLDYLFGFQNLWDSTIKPKDIDKYGWNENPWVWVIEFERIKREDL